MQDAGQGSFAIGWDQVTVDGVGCPDLAECHAGRTWRWSGRAIRLDGPADVLRLAEPAPAAALRRHARRAAARLVSLPQAMPEDEPAMRGPMLVVTDGRRAWPVAVVMQGRGQRPIAHFPATPPPQATDLWIAQADLPPERPATCDTWCGLAAGTPIATPTGEMAVDRLEPGMEVLSPDGLAVRVTDVRSRHVSGARLCVMPGLAPVRIAAGAFGPGLPGRDILVAPDQDIALDGVDVQRLFPVAPVTVAARDAADIGAITRARGVPGMTAHVLRLARPVSVTAAGLALPMGERAALRRLSRGETAILLARAGQPGPRPLARRAERC
jgi:hypothetical protein